MPNIPKTMTAAVLTGHGSFDKLGIRHDWPVPQPQAGEALVKVAACGVNNTDINTRIGWYDDSVSGDTQAGASSGFASVSDDSTGGWGSTGLTFPRIQGADTVGYVVAVGEGVDDDWLEARVLNDTWLRDWSQPMNRDKAGYIGSEADCLDGFWAQVLFLPRVGVELTLSLRAARA